MRSPNIFTVKVRATSDADISADELQARTAVNKASAGRFIRASTETDTVPGSYAGCDVYSTDNSQIKQQGVNKSDHYLLCPGPKTTVIILIN